MKLKEILEQNMGNMVKICTECGTGYFYAARVYPSTFAYLDKIDAKNRISTSKKIEQMQKSISILESRRYLTQSEMASIKGRREQINGMVRFVENWINVLDRDIVEIFQASKTVEPTDTTVIIVKGYESGSYWMCKESGQDVELREGSII